MRIVIWGAGAIGGTLGAYLIRNGHDVLFVDVVEEHVAAINQSGLHLVGPVETFSVKAKAITPRQLDEACGIVLLCTKAQHTREATESLADWLAADGFVMSVQNGLNELIIQEIVGRERTVGAFVNFGADYLEPGKIFFGGRGAVVIGELDGTATERLRQMEALFLYFDENTKTTDDLWGYLWGKEAYGAMLFITALTHESIADALADIYYRPLYIRAAQEILQLAVSIGVQPRSFNGFEPRYFLEGDAVRMQKSLDSLVDFNRQSAKTHSGIWRDLAVRKRKTEVAMFDVILSEGDKAKRAMPFTRRWIEMIHEIEDGKREQSRTNLDELKAELA